jgi:hypothetical protein
MQFEAVASYESLGPMRSMTPRYRRSGTDLMGPRVESEPRNKLRQYESKHFVDKPDAFN